MPRQAKECKNGDGNKHYAKGYCQACYMRVYRNGEAPTPADENLDDTDAPIATKEELEAIFKAASLKQSALDGDLANGKPEAGQ